MTEPSVFSRRLKEIRLKLGLSQRALGIRIGIDQFSASPRMNQYERGKHLPDLLTIERLAHEAGVPLAYFFTRDDALAELLMRWAQLDERRRVELLALATQDVESDEVPD